MFHQWKISGWGPIATPKRIEWDSPPIFLPYSKQRTLTYFVRLSITVWLTSCLTGLDSTKLVNLFLIQHKQSSWILTSQTGGQLYSYPYKVCERSLFKAILLTEKRSKNRWQMTMLGIRTSVLSGIGMDRWTHLGPSTPIKRGLNLLAVQLNSYRCDGFSFLHILYIKRWRLRQKVYQRRSEGSTRNEGGTFFILLIFSLFYLLKLLLKLWHKWVTHSTMRSVFFREHSL